MKYQPFLAFIIILFSSIFIPAVQAQEPPLIIDNPNPTKIEIPLLNDANNGKNNNGNKGDDGGLDKNGKAEIEAAEAAKKKELANRQKEEKAKKNNIEDEKDIIVKERMEKLPEAKIWGQQFFRDQSISLFTRSRDIKAVSNYLLGVGDEILVTVWGRTDFSANVIIDEAGFIDLSGAGLKVPRLYLKGVQFEKAKKAIIERLGNHMNIDNSQWAIELNYSKSITINITGEVFNPGSYVIPALNTAFNALVAAGGPSQIGSVRKIVVSSTNDKQILDVYNFITNPNAMDSFFLKNNDYIYVPLAERVVEVRGAVKREFFYELIAGENLNKLLFYAGELQPDAYKTNIQIKRYENDEERLIDINLKNLREIGGDFELKNGDIIEIKPIKQAYANYVKVSGAVKLPGEFELEPNSRILDVLNKAGIISSAVMDKVYIKRLQADLSLKYIQVSISEVLRNPNSEQNELLRPLDEIEVKYKSDFIDKFNIQVFGSVRQEGSYPYSRNLSLADALYMSNGIKSEAAGSYIEISRLQRDKDSSYIVFQTFLIDEREDSLLGLKVIGAKEFKLEPYDQIFVRRPKAFELPMNIKIEGEVRFPGVYTIENRKEKVLDLLKRVGGTTEIAFLEGAKLMRKGEGFVLLNVKELQKQGEKSPYNYILRDGDEIEIPKIKDLVSIAGAVRHPYIREKTEIDKLEMDLRLKKASTDLEREEMLILDKIGRKTNPLKVNVPFHKGKYANFYIKKYGAGVDRFAGGRKRLVYVRYANGLVKKTRNFLFWKAYPKVEKGAMVFVEVKERRPKEFRQRVPFNWNNFMQNTMAQLMAAITLAAVIRTLF